MTIHGTQAYDGHQALPPLVEAAVALARRAGFGQSCRPEQGALLRLLAGGVGAGVIGETGTGCGVGLAWLATGAGPGARLVSVERDTDRASAARDLFAPDPRVTVVTGDWPALAAHGPFDLLVLDGGGQGKGADPPLASEDWLRPGGVLVMDDFTPAASWPPVHAGRPDAARLYWLRHPRLLATEIRVTPDAATILASYPGPGYAGAGPGTS